MVAQFLLRGDPSEGRRGDDPYRGARVLLQEARGLTGRGVEGRKAVAAWDSAYTAWSRLGDSDRVRKALKVRFAQEFGDQSIADEAVYAALEGVHEELFPVAWTHLLLSHPVTLVADHARQELAGWLPKSTDPWLLRVWSESVVWGSRTWFADQGDLARAVAVLDYIRSRAELLSAAGAFARVRAACAAGVRRGLRRSTRASIRDLRNLSESLAALQAIAPACARTLLARARVEHALYLALRSGEAGDQRRARAKHLATAYALDPRTAANELNALRAAAGDLDKLKNVPPEQWIRLDGSRAIRASDLARALSDVGDELSLVEKSLAAGENLRLQWTRENALAHDLLGGVDDVGGFHAFVQAVDEWPSKDASGRRLRAVLQRRIGESASEPVAELVGAVDDAVASMGVAKLVSRSPLPGSPELSLTDVVAATLVPETRPVARFVAKSLHTGALEWKVAAAIAACAFLLAGVLQIRQAVQVARGERRFENFISAVVNGAPLEVVSSAEEFLDWAERQTVFSAADDPRPELVRERLAEELRSDLARPGSGASGETCIALASRGIPLAEPAALDELLAAADECVLVSLTRLIGAGHSDEAEALLEQRATMVAALDPSRVGQ